MGAREDLDRFDRDYELHQRSLRGERRYNCVDPGQPPHKYTEAAGGRSHRYSDVGIDFGSDLPGSIRDEVKKRLEAYVAALIKTVHDEQRAKLVERAKAEARATLEELGNG